MLLKALQLLPKVFTEVQRLAGVPFEYPVVSLCPSLLDAGCPPTFVYHTRHTCLRLRISRTAVLYLARTSPESLNPYIGVQLHSTPCTLLA